MLAFKFLLKGAIGPFSRYVWPRPSRGAPSDWVIAGASPRGCASGVHACTAEELAYWLASELWIVELGGEIVRAEKKLVAERGRLVRHVEAWDAGAMRELAAACVLRARDAAVGVLRGAGDAAGADAVASLSGEELAARSVAEIEALAADPSGPAGTALRYVAESTEHLGKDVALCAYIAAHAPLSQDGYVRERAWQSRWLVERLGLHAMAGSS